MSAFSVTVFPRAKISTGTRIEGTWDVFGEVILEPKSRDVPKDDLALWCPATFKGDHRKRENVEDVFALGFDVDAAPVPNESELRMALAGRAALVHSSSSHTPSAPRWRLLLQLSRPVTADEYDRLWPVVAGSLPFPVGQEAKDPSRGWYVPRQPEEGEFVGFILPGEPLPVDELLASAPIVVPATSEAIVVPATSAPAPAPAPRAEARRHAMASAMARVWPADGQRRPAHLALSGGLRSEGFSEAEAVEFLCAVYHHLGEDKRAAAEGVCRQTYSKPESAKITGWTRLKSLIDPVVVEATRQALGRDADFSERVQRPLADVEANSPDEENPLGFQFGGFDVEPLPTVFIVEGLVPQEAVGMFYGRADSLKTWMLYSLAVAVSRGEKWLGFTTVKTKVGIVDCETGKRNSLRRLHMLGAGNNPNLALVSFPTLKPNTQKFWDAIAKYEFGLLICDSLRKCNPGKEENDSDESIIPLVFAAEHSERTRCATLFAHHAIKDAGDGWPTFRGSTGIEDQVDFAFGVRKVDVTAQRKTCDVRCDKPGDMPSPDPFTVEVAFDDILRTCAIKRTEKVEPKKVEAPAIDPNRAIILATLEGKPPPGVPYDDLLNVLSGRRQKRKTSISEALLAGDIVDSFQPPRKRHFVMLPPGRAK